MLGSTVKDVVSGFEGLVVGAARYLYSAEQLLVAPQDMRDGKPCEAIWIDAGRLTVTTLKKEAGFKL